MPKIYNMKSDPTLYIFFYTLMIQLKYPHITSKKFISNYLCHVILFIIIFNVL